MPDRPALTRYLAPAGLVAGGMLAGALLSTTLSASATGSDSPSPTPTATSSVTAPTPRPQHCRGMDPDDQGWPSGPARPGAPRAELSGTTAAKVKAAVLAKYPGAAVERMHEGRDGGYVVHVTTKDGKHLHVTLNESYAVTGAKEGPTRGSD